jgi:hypothetical protein
VHDQIMKASQSITESLLSSASINTPDTASSSSTPNETHELQTLQQALTVLTTDVDLLMSAVKALDAKLEGLWSQQDLLVTRDSSRTSEGVDSKLVMMQGTVEGLQSSLQSISLQLDAQRGLLIESRRQHSEDVSVKETQAEALSSTVGGGGSVESKTEQHQMEASSPALSEHLVEASQSERQANLHEGGDKEQILPAAGSTSPYLEDGRRPSPALANVALDEMPVSELGFADSEEVGAFSAALATEDNVPVVSQVGPPGMDSVITTQLQPVMQFNSKDAVVYSPRDVQGLPLPDVIAEGLRLLRLGREEARQEQV